MTLIRIEFQPLTVCDQASFTFWQVRNCEDVTFARSLFPFASPRLFRLPISGMNVLAGSFSLQRSGYGPAAQRLPYRIS
jgi:hypothetical protein